MGVLNSNFIKGIVALTMIVSFVTNCSKCCKTFKKNVNICKSLTACSLLINNDATINGDLVVKGTINGTVGCAAGPVGSVGPKGDTGSAGSPGATGATGPAVVTDYGYFYNTVTNVTLSSLSTVTFSANGPFTSAFTHTVGTDAITVNSTGVYAIYWEVSMGLGGVGSPCQFALTVNGVEEASSAYQQGDVVADDGGILNGFCILSLTAGQVIRLQNIGVGGGATNVLGIGVVTASIVFKKLA